MSKGQFHYNPDTGKSGVCGAEQGNCPFTDPDHPTGGHFDTEAESAAYREARLEKENSARPEGLSSGIVQGGDSQKASENAGSSASPNRGFFGERRDSSIYEGINPLTGKERKHNIFFIRRQPAMLGAETIEQQKESLKDYCAPLEGRPEELYNQTKGLPAYLYTKDGKRVKGSNLREKSTKELQGMLEEHFDVAVEKQDATYRANRNRLTDELERRQALARAYDEGWKPEVNKDLGYEVDLVSEKAPRPITSLPKDYSKLKKRNSSEAFGSYVDLPAGKYYVVRNGAKILGAGQGETRAAGMESFDRAINTIAKKSSDYDNRNVTATGAELHEYGLYAIKGGSSALIISEEAAYKLKASGRVDLSMIESEHTFTEAQRVTGIKARAK